MKIRVSITIDEEEPIDLLTTEREELQAGNLGFSLAETKMLLANGQKTLVDAQAAMHARTRRCEICGEPLRRKDRGTIVARTLFGKIPVDSPRFYRCTCSAVNTSSRASFSPLAELLPERTLPELQYLQVKWAASMSYGLTLEILRDVFPIGDALGRGKPNIRVTSRHLGGASVTAPTSRGILPITVKNAAASRRRGALESCDGRPQNCPKQSF